MILYLDKDIQEDIELFYMNNIEIISFIISTPVHSYCLQKIGN